jgi:hypothetical protein
MIDWSEMFAGFLWVFSLALALATLSYASWQASIIGIKFAARLKMWDVQLVLNLAGILFCSGLILLSDSMLNKFLWAILGLLFLFQEILLFRNNHLKK